jgi:phage tail sheath gpL-like
MTAALPRPASVHQERFSIPFAHPSPGTAVAPVAASGLITCVAKASLVDTDYCTIGDGLSPALKYGFDTAGDGVVDGRATGLITCPAKAQFVDTDYCTIGDGLQPPWVFEFDSVGDGASLQTEGKYATGTIECDTDANGGDGDTLTVSDGINPAVVYEYDKASDGVQAGRVAQAAGTTAASNATALKALIEANQPDLTVTDNLAGILTLTHKFPGDFANITITETGTVYKTVTGMAGGVDGLDAGIVEHGRARVDISADVTAANVAARLRTAILAVMPALSVTDNADGTLTLKHALSGDFANVTITENVGDAGFLVAGMTGGSDPDVAGNHRVQVNVSADVTAANVAARLRTAILANQPSLSVTDNGDGTLTVAHRWPGAGGNVTITENVGDAGFLVAGLTSGAADDTTGATLAVKLFKTIREFVIDGVDYVNPTGLAQDAANYWTIAIKTGANTAFSWSTLTGAQGTLTADAVNALVAHATDTNRGGDAGVTVSLALTKTAAAANLPAGQGMIHGRWL